MMRRDAERLVAGAVQVLHACGRDIPDRDEQNAVVADLVSGRPVVVRDGTA